DAGMPAVAVTDFSNLFALVKFYRAAQSAGIKPITGVDLLVHNDTDPNHPTRLTLLCQHQAGYLNLTRLISRAWLEGQHRGKPMLNRAWLDEEDTSGLIALSGGIWGDVGRAVLADKPDEAKELLEGWKTLFPNSFYLELQRTGRPNEDAWIFSAVKLAAETKTPVVATNDVRFISSSDFESHEARVCIHDGRTLSDPHRPRKYTRQQYLRTPEEMQELFSDIPEAIENTVEIAKRCNIKLTLGENFLPDFPVPKGETLESCLVKDAQTGLKKRFEFLKSQHENFEEKIPEYEERLQIELNVIKQMGFPGYFLIVADFIEWAKNNDVPVGPGRGSGAGSLVAYALGITDLDPLEYDLLFERFLNPERVSLPDFDIDFCMAGRDRVIEYVAERYGRDKVSQIITYGTMAAKAVVRDVGRVLGHPYGFVDQIAKLIPFDLGITLDKALEQEETLKERYDNEDEVRTLIDLARSLEGITRNAGKHAGGVVISPSVLTDFTPLYCEQGGTNVVTQFDKDDVEAVGLVKFDFLGLRTLTIIDWAVKDINRTRAALGEEPLNISAIALDDPVTFEFLQGKKGATTRAVFQLESRGMQELIKKLQPDTFEDIVALVALFRPGPLQSGMVDDFIDRKHGRMKVEYPHPDIAPVLKPTYGVILYQEQVMQIAQVLAGYSLGAADLLRRAMGKKKPEEMAKQREIFVTGAKENDVEESVATYIFDLMEKFAGYGFNKSHSAAYALLSYQTAWLKTHHPSAFMAAVLSSDMDNTDKVMMLIEECRDMKLKVEIPNINTSEYSFTTNGDSTILYGLGAIKGVGEAAIEGIILNRSENGTFSDLYDFCRRIDLRKVNRRVMEALIRAGAMDELGPNRATLMTSLGSAIQTAEQHQRNHNAGVQDMFGFAEVEKDETHPEYKQQQEWDEDVLLNNEKETLGVYLTGHPITKYEPELKQFTSDRLINIDTSRERKVTVAGLIFDLQTRNTRKGDRMAFITLDDRTARKEITVFSKDYARFQHLIAKDKLVVIKGLVGPDPYSGNERFRAEEIYDIDQARNMFAKRLVININAAQTDHGFAGSLAKVLDPFREGQCPVVVNYTSESARAPLVLGADWRVQPTDTLIQRLRELAGSEDVSVQY
ncbi:MAG: DNA polymerase III subunit alpha, partial [Gammaproteobacteria bacterium]|nr:DNA polymerase III subunit alpha [Gammaproteobacteria bacterium]